MWLANPKQLLDDHMSPMGCLIWQLLLY